MSSLGFNQNQYMLEGPMGQHGEQVSVQAWGRGEGSADAEERAASVRNLWIPVPALLLRCDLGPVSYYSWPQFPICKLEVGTKGSP